MKNSAKKNRQLRIESLEIRELLSVNPLGIDNFDTLQAESIGVPAETSGYEAAADIPQIQAGAGDSYVYKTGDFRITVSNITTNSLRLNWSSISGITGYTLVYSPAISGKTSESLPKNYTYYDINGLESGKEYRFILRAETNGSYVSDSDTLSVTTKSAAPVKLSTPSIGTVISDTATDRKVAWSHVANWSSYRLEWSTSSSFSSSSTQWNITSTSHIIKNLTAGTYYVRLMAVGDGTNYTNSDWSEPKSFTIQATVTPPPAPNLHYESPQAGTSAYLSWDSVSAADSYSVEKRNSSGTYEQVYKGTNRSYSDSSVSAGTTYYYRVYSWTGTTKGTDYSAAIITVKQPAPQPPVIDNVSAEGTTVHITWHAASSGTTPAGYQIYVQNTSTGEYFVSDDVGNRTYYDAYNVPAGNYRVFLYAVNSEGNSSGRSQEKTVTVNKPIDPPTKPIISVQPKSATYTIGDVAVSLAVSYSGCNGEVSFRWYDVSTGNIVSTSPAYVPPTGAEGTKSYYCIVRNTVENDYKETQSDTATITVSKQVPGINVIQTHLIKSNVYDITVEKGNEGLYLTNLTAAQRDQLRTDINYGFYIPYDAEKTYDGDTLLCWAASSANMLAYAGWTRVDGFNNADEYLAYFTDCFSDNGSTAYYGNEWFIKGTYSAPIGSTWAKLEVPNSGGFYSKRSIDWDKTAGSQSIVSASGITDAIEQMRSGAAVGIAIGWYNSLNERTGGHAITLWGVEYDASKAPTEPGYYTALLVSDSDDRDGFGNKADALKRMTITWDANFGRYHVQYNTSNTGILESFNWLAQCEVAPSSSKDVTTTVGKPGNFKAVQSGQNVVLTWSEASNAKTYRVSRWDNATGKWVDLTKGATGLTLTNSNVPPGTQKYLIRAYNGTIYGDSVTVSINVTGTKPAAPKNLTAKALPKSGSKEPVQINWNTAAGATHYILHRWEEGDYKLDSKGNKVKNWKVIYEMKPSGLIPSGGTLSTFQVVNSDVSKVTAKRVQYLVRGYNGTLPGESANVFVTVN